MSGRCLHEYSVRSSCKYLYEMRIEAGHSVVQLREYEMRFERSYLGIVRTAILLRPIEGLISGGFKKTRLSHSLLDGVHYTVVKAF